MMNKLNLNHNVRNKLDHIVRNRLFIMRSKIRKHPFSIKCLICIERFFEFIYLIGPRG